MRKIGKMVSGAAVLLMLAAACGGKEGRGADFSEGKNRDIEVIDIDKAKREKALLYSSILEEPDVIVLETNPECIIQDVSAIDIYEGNIYILDDEHVAVPTVDAVAVCFEADGVQVSFRGGPEGSVSLIRQAAELRGFGEHVEAELVSFGEETAEGGFEVGGFRERFRLRCSDVGRTHRLSCRSFFVPPPYGIMCNPFKIHSSCV